MLSSESQSTSHFLDLDERKKIRLQVNLAVARLLVKMSFLGGLANVISGLLLVWLAYKWTNSALLLIWYALLVVANFTNIGFCRYYQDKLNNPKHFRIWRLSLLIVFAIICLIWGTIPLIFRSGNVNYELAILAFLLAVVIGFSFPSICDFKLALISICGLLTPSIVYYISEAILYPMGSRAIAFGVSSSLFILALFLLTVTNVSSRLVNQFFKLTFTNALLNHKLENTNKFLEQRVKERTYELEQTLQQVTHRAAHDLLTDLPNQRSLISYLKKIISNARTSGKMFAIAFYFVNELDRIYNALGYQAGDRVLKKISERFDSAYGQPTTPEEIEDFEYIVTLARNDVFVIIIQNLSQLNDLEAKIKALFSILDKPFSTEKQVIKLTASIGVSIFPRNGRNITSLLMNADAAMLLAKQSGGNTLKMYKSEINAAITRQLELESRLHTAIIKSEFILKYQPIIDLRTGKMVGAEALIRWENPAFGTIPPDHFIPLAEANGMIIPLGEWVLRSVCQQITFWNQAGFTNFRIAVNLSAKQLQSRNLINSVANILKEFDLNPSFIEFELTETAAFRQEVIPILKEFKSIGFNLSIDDFGTGYSGLTNIKLFSVDKIKIDKSFVHDVNLDNDSRAIVSNTIALGKNLNVLVVAEGVETKDQLDFLITNGCDLAQGFYFSVPVEADELTRLLKNDNNYLK
jgi:diguanylate cyclase (GGDEF)-like protein